MTTLGLLLALLLFPSHVAAEPHGADLEVELTALMNAGRVEDARKLLLSQPHDDVDLQLFEGRVLKLQNQFSKSAELLEQALRKRPTDIVIRRELAHVLFLGEQYHQAQLHLNKLMRQDPDATLRRQYMSMLKVIKDKRKLSFGLSIALEPSTNITNGASAEYFHTPTASIRIDDSSREASGLGLTLGLTSTFSALQTELNELVFDLGVTGTRYSVSQANSKNVYKVGAAYTVFNARSRFEIRPYWKKEVSHGRVDQTTLGLSLNWTKKILGDGELNAVLTTERQTKDVSPKTTGTDSSLLASYKHYMSQRTAVQVGLLLEQNKIGLIHNQYVGQRVDVAMDHLFSSGLLAHARLSFGHRNFTENFPLLSFERIDDYAEVVVQVQNNSWHFFGFSPIATCKHVQNRSNINLYSYKSTSCAASLSREF